MTHLGFSPIVDPQSTFAMGATFSYLGYASHQQPHPRSHEQLHYSSLVDPALILGNGDVASPSFIDLYTRLAALQKDLQISRAENTNKEAIIQYLLSSSVNNTRVREITVKLKEQLRVLKTANDRITKEKEEIEGKLGNAKNTISALTTPGVFSSVAQSTSTSFSSRSDSPPKSEPVTEDLIDLLDCSQESGSQKLVEDDTTLLDDFYEEESDVERVLKNTTPDQSLHQSSDSEFEGSSYIVRFANSDEEIKPQDAVKISHKVIH